jgi:ATP-dependent DNA ligase
LGGRGRQISEFEASLVYKVSSRTARAIQRNLVSIKKKKKTKRKRMDAKCWCEGKYMGLMRK